MTISKILFTFILLNILASTYANDAFLTPFEKGNGNQTAEYDEVIGFYQQLSDRYKTITIDAAGKTDSGFPLHTVTFKTEQSSSNNTHSNPITVLINNGIHPGEPDGIDATMMLFRDYAQGKIQVPKNTVLVTIPVYNIGGALNRNTTTRTNQNGPESYGFRGNARNYDLNRDFIKADTLNTRSFMTIFHQIKPDFFIDNHVSNGADYQYVLTHLMTQHNKLGGQLGEYLKNTFQPELEKTLKNKDWPITPYVNVFNRPPEEGFSQFFDSPRYSTGYAALFNTPGMMVETHMLKPYQQRVKGTYVLMQSVIEHVSADRKEIRQLRAKSVNRLQAGDRYPIQWQLDEETYSIIDFLGYEADIIPSQVTGLERLKYNRQKPVKKKIKYRDTFKPSLEITIPKAYIIPQGWHQVIELLNLNQIEMKKIGQDTTKVVEAYRIEEYSTSDNSYEGHYPHHNITLSKSIKNISFRTGDYYISTNQPGVRYLLEVLEPQAVDSLFKWNYFDSILNQKEGFSPYVWEEHAHKLLSENPVLKEKFNAKRNKTPDFSDNAYQQLQWLHHQSKHYENAHLNYPVYRILP